MNKPAIDEEEAQPRFLLSAEPAGADAVAAVLGVLRPAGLLLRLSVASDGSPDIVGDLRGVARTAGIAFLIEDDVDLALQVAADGIQLSGIDQVQNVRDRLSEDHLIGASAGRSRHDAITAGEHGADYVTFGDLTDTFDDEIIELVRWWRSTTVLPCLACAADAEDVTRLAGVGTDFIGIFSAIWDHADGPLAAARLLQQAIEAS